MFGAQLNALFVRIRPDFGSFKAEMASGLKPALSEAQAAIAATARANIAQTQKEIAANRELALSYRRIGGAARAGSQEAIIASKLAAEATARADAQLGRTRRTGVGGIVGAGIGKTAAQLGGVTAALYVLQRGLRAVVVGGADFETSLNVFQAVSEATAGQMRAVSAEAKKLGADITLPKVSAGDAAQAMTELAKGGVSVQDALEGARGTLQLAAAGAIDVGSAAGIVAQQLNVFGLAGDKAVHVADLLAGAANSAQGEVSDMAMALSQSALVARNAGYSVEDTVSAIALLAKNGLIGSDAGTSLRTTLLRLVPPTKEARQQIAALGIATQDQAGKLLPLGQLFDNYRNALMKLEKPSERQLALLNIFGTDAIRAATVFTREGSKGFDEMAASVNREGAAADFAAARTKGLAGSWGALKSNLETIAITWSQSLNPVIKKYLDRLNEGDTVQRKANAALEQTKSVIREVADAWNTLFPPVRDAVKAIGGVGNAFELLFAIGIARRLAPIITGIAGVGTAATAARGTSAVGVLGLGAALRGLPATIAITVAIEAIINRKKIDDFFEENGLGFLNYKVDPKAFLGAALPMIDAAKNVSNAARERARGLAPQRTGPWPTPDEFFDADPFGMMDRLFKDVHRKMGAAGAASAEWFSKNVAEGLASGAGAPAPKIPKAIQDGIDMARRGIEDLKTKLQETIEQNARDLTDSIEQAKGNLIQIGSSLASSISAAIDEPFAEAARKIQAEQNKLALQFDTRNAALEAQSRRLQRLQAALSARSGRRALENLREQVVLPGGGGLSADPKKALAQLEALAAKHTTTRGAVLAFIEDWQAAMLQVQSDDLGKKQGALADRRAEAETPLQLRGERLRVGQDAAEERKRQITTQIGDLTTALAGHDITYKQFNKRIAKILSADGTSYKKAGALLGDAFREGFEAQVSGILAQAKAVSVSPHRPGTGQEPKIVRPLETLEKNAAAVAAITRDIGDQQIKLQTRIAKATEAAAKKAFGKDANIVQLPPSKKMPGKQGVISEALTGTTG